jgi:hypothetical protein
MKRNGPPSEKMFRAYGAAALNTITRLNAMGKQIKQAIRLPVWVDCVAKVESCRAQDFSRKH